MFSYCQAIKEEEEEEAEEEEAEEEEAEEEEAEEEKEDAATLVTHCCNSLIKEDVVLRTSSQVLSDGVHFSADILPID